MVRRCTDQTLYLRLLGGLDPVHAIADPIKNGTPCGRVDIGAFTGQDLVGIASLVPSRGAWEAAILVEDAWQGNRVGSHLADNLVEQAVRLGIDTIRVSYGGRNRRAASLVTSRAHDLTGLSVSAGVIERYVAPRTQRRQGTMGTTNSRSSHTTTNLIIRQNQRAISNLPVEPAGLAWRVDAPDVVKLLVDRMVNQDPSDLPGASCACLPVRDRRVQCDAATS